MKKNILAAALLTLIMGAAVSANAEDVSVMDKLEAEGTLTPVYQQDFEEWTGGDGQLNVDYDVVEDMGKGKTLKVVCPPKAESQATVVLSAPIYGNAVIKYSVYFSENNVKRKILGTIRDSGNKNETFHTLMNDNGTMLQKPSNAVLGNYLDNTWYDVVFVYNMDTRKYDFYMNDELIVSKGDMLNSDGTLNTGIANIGRVSLVGFWQALTETYAWVDDITFYTYQITPTATLLKDTVVYDEDEIKLEFSAPIDSATINNAVSIKDENGNAVKANGTLSENGLSYTLTLKQVLKPSTRYTVSFADGIASKEELPLTTEYLEFATEAAIISEILFNCGGNDMTSMEGTAGKTVSPYCYNNSDTDKEVILIVALFDGNRIVKLSSKQRTLQPGKRINTGIAVPNDGKAYTIKAFVWDGTENQNAYIATAELK